MKRVHTADDIKNAAPKVIEKLGELKLSLSESDAAALDDMMQAARQHAESVSDDELAAIAAGVGGKPHSKGWTRGT
jgi:hypothetical protein